MKKIIIQEKNINKLLQYVYTNGIFLVSDLVGGYSNLLKLTGNNIPDDLKIQDIKDKIKEIDGIGLGEFAYHIPIFIKSIKNEIHEVGFIGMSSVVVDVFSKDENGYEYPTDEYRIYYENLPTKVLDEVCEVIYKSLKS